MPVELGSELYTDALQSYAFINDEFAHQVIGHAIFYYLDEQAFRYNNRNMNDLRRFVYGLRKCVGKRFTYAELTGKTLVEQHG